MGALPSGGERSGDCVQPAVQMVLIHLASLPNPLLLRQLPGETLPGAARSAVGTQCSVMPWGAGPPTSPVLGGASPASAGTVLRSAAGCLHPGWPSVPSAFSLWGGGPQSVGPVFQPRPRFRSVFQASSLGASVHSMWVFPLHLLSALW